MSIRRLIILERVAKLVITSQFYCKELEMTTDLFCISWCHETSYLTLSIHVDKLHKRGETKLSNNKKKLVNGSSSDEKNWFIAL